MLAKAVLMNQVTFKYKSSNSLALRNVSLEIDDGDFVLVVGYSGSGKSTFLKTINGLIPNFHAGSFGGSVRIFDEDVSETSTAALAKTVGFVFQNPENQLSALTVEKEIAFPLENFGVPKDEMIARIDEIVEMLDIEKIRYKSPFLISGGEQQLAAIAAALALDPKILILDEVTAHLSPKSAKAILSKLSHLNSEYNKTIILSEHRLDRCITFANKLAYIENGRLLIYDNVVDALTNSKYPRDLMPKISSIYLRLKMETNNFENIDEGVKAKLLKSKLPLSIDDLIEMVKGGIH